MKLTFLLSSFLNLIARSIASKGKSDVKESTDSSTTIDDDEKGTYDQLLFLTFILILLQCVFLRCVQYIL